jgi:hypothetical protein
LGIILWSDRVKGQDVKFVFEEGEIAIEKIVGKESYQLVMKTRDSVWELWRGNLYKYDQLSWNYFIMNVWERSPDYVDYIRSVRDDNRIVVPHERNAYGFSSELRFFITKQFKAKSIDISVDSLRIFSGQDTIGTYRVSPWHSTNVNAIFKQSKLTALILENLILNFRLACTLVDSFCLSDVILDKEIDIEDSPLPKYIHLNGVICKDEKIKLDFSQFRITDSSKDCDLNIGVGIANLIKANYKYFRLVFDSTTSVYDKEQVYTELLNMQKTNYFLDGCEKLDKEYKAFKYLHRNSFIADVQNWIDKYWWDYGYDKFMVIKNSVKLFLLFFAINLLAYKGLAKVYHPIKFREFDERLEMNNVDIKHPVAAGIKKYLKRIPVIFLYTAFVFWGLKLDLKELEIKKPLYMTILIGQYITGLVCLAYIANYIISK